MFGGRSFPVWCVWLSSVARSCATRDGSNKDNNHTHHTGKERPPNTIRPILVLIVGTVHNPRHGGIDSLPL